MRLCRRVLSGSRLVFGNVGKPGSVLMLEFLSGTVQTEHAPIAERGYLLLAPFGHAEAVVTCLLLGEGRT